MSARLAATYAAVAYAANCALGLAVASRRLRTGRARWVHHALYINTAASTTAATVALIAERGRAGKLSIDDLTGSTFTITNPGPFGSFMSAPIINVPNVAILSTETVAKRPTVITTPDGQDMIAIRHIGYLGLSWDHRAFDGSTAVLFLQRIRENLETWDWEQELA